MQRMGRRRLPPAKVEWRMARWMEWGSVVAEGRRRSSAASVRVTPEVRMSCTSGFMVMRRFYVSWEGGDVLAGKAKALLAFSF